MADHALHDMNAAGHAALSIGRASFLIPARQEQPELLDQGAGSMTDVRANLSEIWRINRVFGGIDALTRHLYPCLRKHTRPVQVVDLGTGSGEMGSLLMSWAERHRQQIAVSMLDLSERNLSVAAEHMTSGVRLVQANALALPFARDQIDYFISSLFLHHLSPDQVVSLLRETYQRARHGIVMSDVTRGYLPLAAFRLVQPLFARHYLTRHDGVVSIKRAYTPKELRSLSHAAGIETARVYEHVPWRMTLVAV
jgi:ubiquinone/menaquinone biosynthesis C-methylase UbiE